MQSATATYRAITVQFDFDVAVLVQNCLLKKMKVKMKINNVVVE